MSNEMATADQTVTVWAYTLDDVSPNAMRSSHNPTRILLTTSQPEYNMSHQPCEEGWSGTTNDTSEHVLGSVEIDPDSPDWESDLQAILPDEACLTRSTVEDWLRGGADDDLEIDSAEGDLCGSRSATWSETAEDQFYPTERDSWQFLLYLDDPGNSLFSGISRSDLTDDARGELGALDADDLVAIVEASGADCDDIDHETYDSGTCGEDWRYLLVREADCQTAVSALAWAAHLLHRGLDLEECIDRIEWRRERRV
jgi:hypothetical protein